MLAHVSLSGARLADRTLYPCLHRMEFYAHRRYRLIPSFRFLDFIQPVLSIRYSAIQPGKPRNVSRSEKIFAELTTVVG